jgi:hypothetical protein
VGESGKGFFHRNGIMRIGGAQFRDYANYYSQWFLIEFIVKAAIIACGRGTRSRIMPRDVAAALTSGNLKMLDGNV